MFSEIQCYFLAYAGEKVKQSLKHNILICIDFKVLIYLHFICQSASESVVTPGCAMCRDLKTALNNRLLHSISVPKTIFLKRHGDSLILPFNAFFFID